MTLASGIHLTNISGEWEFQKSLFFLVNNFSYFPLQINDNIYSNLYNTLCFTVPLLQTLSHLILKRNSNGSGVGIIVLPI